MPAHQQAVQELKRDKITLAKASGLVRGSKY
jgi:hypothetical protein